MALKQAVKRNKKQAAAPLALWRRLGADYLLTNDSGSFVRLSGKDFALVTAGRVPEKHPRFAELSAGGFIRGRLDFNALAARWKKKNAHLGSGPGLHILVLTLRCDHKCLYCQSGAAGPRAAGTDMPFATARKCVDFAFNSPNPGITLEFQGGEPLLNWDTLRRTVAYARGKARTAGKELKLALVSNFSLMTAGKARFLLDNEVSVCTSLDGPRGLHNANRPRGGGDPHAATVKWLEYFRKEAARQGPGLRIFKPSALLTVTRDSLSRHKEIIDEYARLGLEDIFIRPLAPIGYARLKWDTIGYGAAEFAAFYRKSLDYILALNRRGAPIREKMASLMLEKIVNFRDPGYLDARCPCGAAIGQIAYAHNGDLYACDEGRMVGWEGDDTFRIGNVFRDSYKKTVSGPVARMCALSSNLEAQPSCARCAYSPWCGVCPVYNYSAQGSVWGDMASSERCVLFKGVFDALFTLLNDPAKAEILKKWVAEHG